MRASQRAGRRSAQLRRQFSDSVAIPGASKKLQFANKPSKRVINAVRDPFRILKIGAVGAVGAAAAAVVYTQIEHDASSQPVMGAQLQNIFWCKMEDLGVAAFAQAEPYTIESLDAQQLQRILGASGSLGPGTTVRAVSYTLEERGPFRDIYRLHIVYSGGTGPKTVIVKLSPAGSANADRRLRARLAGCYGNEVSFHTSVAEIAEDAGVSLPKVYLALHDPASARMVLIVDDTDKVEESSADLTTEQARVAVDSLAALVGLNTHGNVYTLAIAFYLADLLILSTPLAGRAGQRWGMLSYDGVRVFLVANQRNQPPLLPPSKIRTRWVVLWPRRVFSESLCRPPHMPLCRLWLGYVPTVKHLRKTQKFPFLCLV